MSYLSLSHRSNCFLDHPCHPPCPNFLPICHPLIELHRSLHPILPPFLVLDRLSTCTNVHSCRPPLPFPTLAVLPPSTCSPGPCRPLQPHATSPFRPILSPSGRPHFASVPVNPCGLALIGSFCPPPLLEPLFPPSGLDLRPGPCRSQGGSFLQFLVSCPPHPCFLFTRSCASPSLGVFW